MERPSAVGTRRTRTTWTPTVALVRQGKCPKILNDWTKAQPHIDKANRWRQRELAIEERFSTHSFPFRLFTTVIVGMSISSAWPMFQYFVNDKMFSTFSEFVDEVAVDGMQWEGGLEERAAAAERARNAADQTSAANSVPREAHVAVPISSIRGWKGAAQPRCSHCQAQTSYCCLQCSSAQGLVAIHRGEYKTGGKTVSTPCLAAHMADPEASHRTSASASKMAAAKKRHAGTARGRGGGKGRGSGRPRAAAGRQARGA